MSCEELVAIGTMLDMRITLPSSVLGRLSGRDGRARPDAKRAAPHRPRRYASPVRRDGAARTRSHALPAGARSRSLRRRVHRDRRIPTRRDRALHARGATLEDPQRQTWAASDSEINTTPASASATPAFCMRASRSLEHDPSQEDRARRIEAGKHRGDRETAVERRQHIEHVRGHVEQTADDDQRPDLREGRRGSYASQA